MSDYDFPELPSDEELGITEEDRKKYEEDLPDDGPEMSDAELAALLGTPKAPKGAAGKGAVAEGPGAPGFIDFQSTDFNVEGGQNA